MKAATRKSTRFVPWQGTLITLLQEFAAVTAISFWLSVIMINTCGTLLACCLLWHSATCLPASLFLLVQLVVVLLPVRQAPRFVDRWIDFSVHAALVYFSCRVTVEEPDCLQAGQPYIVAMEPHSAVPLALPMVFTDHCELLPKGLQGIKILGHSAAMYMAGTRHFWWWLGVRPIDRANVDSLLRAKHSVAMVPGGISETMVMQPGQEVMYLRKRLGFVRLALKHGVPLVPAFAFGQSDAYRWIRMQHPYVPQPVIDVIRRLFGFVPMLVYGAHFSAVPFKVPIHVVIGSPLVLPQIDEPSKENVQKYLNLYIEAMQGLCSKHKHEAGYGSTDFVIV